MLKFKRSRSVVYIFITAMGLGLFITGCSDDEPETENTATDESPQMIERQAPRKSSAPDSSPEPAEREEDFRVMPEVEGSLQHDGMGLETIIDASNKQAYADSLKWIAEDVSREQFDRLESSIRYIHMYDSSVFGDEDKLRSLIDGKTGNEVIEHAKKIKQQRNGN